MKVAGRTKFDDWKQDYEAVFAQTKRITPLGSISSLQSESDEFNYRNRCP